MGRFLLYRSESPDVVLFVGSARVFAAKFLQQRVNAVMVGADSFFLSRRDQLVGLAACLPSRRPQGDREGDAEPAGGISETACLAGASGDEVGAFRRR